MADVCSFPKRDGRIRHRLAVETLMTALEQSPPTRVREAFTAYLAVVEEQLAFYEEELKKLRVEWR